MTTSPDLMASALDVAPEEEVPPTLRLGDPLSAAVEAFHSHPSARLLPVLDPEERPVGALFETDVRKLLFNPYGHALLRNPSVNHRLDRLLRDCPIAEADLPISVLIDAYTASGGREGMILTRSGRFARVLPNRALLALVGRREGDLARRNAERLARLDAIGRGFRQDAAELARALIDASQEIRAMASGVSARAAATGDRSSATAVAAAETQAGMRDVAARSAALSDGLAQVTRQIEEARRSRADAMALVATGGTHVALLSDAADEINDVVETIKAISARVNLLAINATIEAARAGEAGRGFSIVAGEVKALAGQTKAAAGGITDRVAHIRSSIATVLAGQGGMQEVIGRIEAMAMAVETAFAEEGAVVNHIAAHAVQAVEASEQIRTNVSQITDSVSDATRSAAEMQTMARALAERAAALGSRVDAFIEESRAA